jgi:ectoine hydroxylase
LNGGMTYSTPAETTTAELAKTVAEEGWSVVGALDGPLTRRLLRAVDEVAARSPDAGKPGQLHQLSGLAQHPDLAAVVDWPPLLALVIELLPPGRPLAAPAHRCPPLAS